MQKIILTFLIATLLISLLIAKKHIPNSTHRISGVVRYHEVDITRSIHDPEGYYIESPIIGKIYINGDRIDDTLNKNIRGTGKLKEVCGQERWDNCYPMINLDGFNVEEDNQ